LGTLLEGFRRANADRAAMPRMTHADIEAALEAAPSTPTSPQRRPPMRHESGVGGWIALLAFVGIFALALTDHLGPVIGAGFVAVFMAGAAISTT
jgi:hypothetical protein